MLFRTATTGALGTFRQGPGIGYIDLAKLLIVHRSDLKRGLNPVLHWHQNPTISSQREVMP